MKTINTVLAQEKNPEKEIRPVVPHEHPIIKPNVNPERERSEPFHPSPEIFPVPKPEINPKKINTMDKTFKILLATDFSEAVMNAERYAVQFAKATN